MSGIHHHHGHHHGHAHGAGGNRPSDRKRLAWTLGLTVAYMFAEVVGLEHSDWLSYDYVDADYPDDNPDVIAVT